MNCYKSLVIDVAVGEIGYTEKKSLKDIFNSGGAGSNNYTKYSWYFDNQFPNFYNGKKQGAPWCDIFVDWCFCKAYGVENARRLLCQPEKSLGAGCTYSMRYFIKAGRFHRSNPQTGDQIFFGKTESVISNSTATHTGLVIRVDDKKVYTVEGNKNNKVVECSYKLTDKNIIGYGIPNYDPEPLPQEETFKVGDIVEFTGDKHYLSYNSNLGSAARPGLATITKIMESDAFKIKHPYHLIRTADKTSNVWG